MPAHKQYTPDKQKALKVIIRMKKRLAAVRQDLQLLHTVCPIYVTLPAHYVKGLDTYENALDEFKVILQAWPKEPKSKFLVKPIHPEK